MTTEEKYSIARWAMEHAVKKGAGEARVAISNTNSSEIEVRENQIDKLQEANQVRMRIHLYVNNRYSSIATNRLGNKQELGKFIEEAITGTRYLAEDPMRTLPDPDLYYHGEMKDLSTVDRDFESVDPRQKIEQAFAIEKEALDADDRVISVSSTYSDNKSGSVIVASNGFGGDRENSYYYMRASVSVKDGESRPRGYWSETSIFHKDLVKEGVGKQALKRALDKIGQEKIASGNMTMVVENRSAGGNMVRPLISSLSGSSIQQKNSFLIGRKGQRIGSDLMTLTDDPFIISGRASRLFDNEGLATRKRAIVENGVLRDYFIDTYYAKKLEMEPTSGETTNLVFKPGEKDLEELIAEVERGILVNGFNGGNSNGSTGDFSYGIEGFLIKDGKLVQPVAEMNVSGNFRQLWDNLVAVGNDVYTGSSWMLPSLVFENVGFSGI